MHKEPVDAKLKLLIKLCYEVVEHTVCSNQVPYQKLDKLIPVLSSMDCNLTG